MRPLPIVHYYDGHVWVCRCCGRTSVRPCDCPCSEGRVNGMLVLSDPVATVGLIVRDGEVADTAPYARRYLGRDVNGVLAANHSGRRGLLIAWLPDDVGTPE